MEVMLFSLEIMHDSTLSVMYREKSWVPTENRSTVDGFSYRQTHTLQSEAGNKECNLQTFSSACPYGWVCSRLHCPGCSPGPCPGGRLQRRSCGGRRLEPGSGKRVTGSVGGPGCILRDQTHLHPPCHPPNATAPLQDQRKHKDKWPDRKQSAQEEGKGEKGEDKELKAGDKWERGRLDRWWIFVFTKQFLQKSLGKLWTVIHWLPA